MWHGWLPHCFTCSSPAVPEDRQTFIYHIHVATLCSNKPTRSSHRSFFGPPSSMAYGLQNSPKNQLSWRAFHYYETSFWNSCIQWTRNVCWTVALSLSSSPVQSVPRNSEGRWNASACLSWGQISSSVRPQHVRNSFCFLTQLSSKDGIFIRWFVGTVTVLNDIFYSYFDCITVYISDFQTYMEWSKFTI